MRRKKLNDRIDLDVHQMLTAIAARVGIPRGTVLNRLLREVLNHSHNGRFVLLHGRFQLWDVGQPFITIGRPGPVQMRENGEQLGQRFAEIEFRKSRHLVQSARDGAIRIRRAG
jgi:hypothetical protein